VDDDFLEFLGTIDDTDDLRPMDRLSKAVVSKAGKSPGGTPVPGPAKPAPRPNPTAPTSAPDNG
jgi:hypothetical protein